MSAAKIKGLVKGKDDQLYDLVTVITLNDDDIEEGIGCKKENLKENIALMKNMKEIIQNEKQLVTEFKKKEKFRLKVKGHIKKVKTHNNEEMVKKYFEQNSLNNSLHEIVDTTHNNSSCINDIIDKLKNVESVQFLGQVRKINNAHSSAASCDDHLNEVAYLKRKREKSRTYERNMRDAHGTHNKCTPGTVRPQVEHTNRVREKEKIMNTNPNVKEKIMNNSVCVNNKMVPPFVRIKNKIIQKKKKKIAKKSSEYAENKLNNVNLSKKLIKKFYEIKKSMKNLHKAQKVLTKLPTINNSDSINKRNSHIVNLNRGNNMLTSTNCPLKVCVNYEKNKLYFNALFKHIRTKNAPTKLLMRNEILHTNILLRKSKKGRTSRSTCNSHVDEEAAVQDVAAGEMTVEMVDNKKKKKKVSLCENEFINNTCILKENIKEYKKKKGSSIYNYENKLSSNASGTAKRRSTKSVYDETVLSESDVDDIEYFTRIKEKNSKKYADHLKMLSTREKEDTPKKIAHVDEAAHPGELTNDGKAAHTGEEAYVDKKIYGDKMAQREQHIYNGVKNKYKLIKGSKEEYKKELLGVSRNMKNAPLKNKNMEKMKTQTEEGKKVSLSSITSFNSKSAVNKEIKKINPDEKNLVDKESYTKGYISPSKSSLFSSVLKTKLHNNEANKSSLSYGRVVKTMNGMSNRDEENFSNSTAKKNFLSPSKEIKFVHNMKTNYHKLLHDSSLKLEGNKKDSNASYERCVNGGAKDGYMCSGRRGESSRDIIDSRGGSSGSCSCLSRDDGKNDRPATLSGDKIPKFAWSNGKTEYNMNHKEGDKMINKSKVINNGTNQGNKENCSLAKKTLTRKSSCSSAPNGSNIEYSGGSSDSGNNADYGNTSKSDYQNSQEGENNIGQNDPHLIERKNPFQNLQIKDLHVKEVNDGKEKGNSMELSPKQKIEKRLLNVCEKIDDQDVSTKEEKEKELHSFTKNDTTPSSEQQHVKTILEVGVLLDNQFFKQNKIDINGFPLKNMNTQMSGSQISKGEGENKRSNETKRMKSSDNAIGNGKFQMFNITREANKEDSYLDTNGACGDSTTIMKQNVILDRVNLKGRTELLYKEEKENCNDQKFVEKKSIIVLSKNIPLKINKMMMMQKKALQIVKKISSNSTERTTTSEENKLKEEEENANNGMNNGINDAINSGINNGIKNGMNNGTNDAINNNMNNGTNRSTNKNNILSKSFINKSDKSKEQKNLNLNNFLKKAFSPKIDIKKMILKNNKESFNSAPLKKNSCLQQNENIGKYYSNNPSTNNLEIQQEDGHTYEDIQSRDKYHQKKEEIKKGCIKKAGEKLSIKKSVSFKKDDERKEKRGDGGKGGEAGGEAGGVEPSVEAGVEPSVEAGVEPSVEAGIEAEDGDAGKGKGACSDGQDKAVLMAQKKVPPVKSVRPVKIQSSMKIAQKLENIPNERGFIENAVRRNIGKILDKPEHSLVSNTNLKDSHERSIVQKLLDKGEHNASHIETPKNEDKIREQQMEKKKTEKAISKRTNGKVSILHGKKISLKRGTSSLLFRKNNFKINMMEKYKKESDGKKQFGSSDEEETKKEEDSDVSSSHYYSSSDIDNNKKTVKQPSNPEKLSMKLSNLTLDAKTEEKDSSFDVNKLSSLLEVKQGKEQSKMRGKEVIIHKLPNGVITKSRESGFDEGTNKKEQIVEIDKGVETHEPKDGAINLKEIKSHPKKARLIKKESFANVHRGEEKTEKEAAAKEAAAKEAAAKEAEAKEAAAKEAAAKEAAAKEAAAKEDKAEIKVPNNGNNEGAKEGNEKEEVHEKNDEQLEGNVEEKDPLKQDKQNTTSHGNKATNMKTLPKLKMKNIKNMQEKKAFIKQKFFIKQLHNMKNLSTLKEFPLKKVESKESSGNRTVSIEEESDNKGNRNCNNIKNANVSDEEEHNNHKEKREDGIIDDATSHDEAIILSKNISSQSEGSLNVINSKKKEKEEKEKQESTSNKLLSKVSLENVVESSAKKLTEKSLVKIIPKVPSKIVGNLIKKNLFKETNDIANIPKVKPPFLMKPKSKVFNVCKNVEDIQKD
ncbi:conserved Plasmodium protein, unknown function [Plasmodium malariae]|uniref:Uncharacterized protein n=1 Tax=Plasmodium malariae TaxID=5858 RepID=A0A1C3KE37_PLAMA|nr:conserved Plasmodium protein, unknown function [Plasmodium malariae]